MRKLGALMLGFCLIASEAWAQSYNPFTVAAYDSAYGLLLMQQDPWTYGTGAGPAVGWGIGGAAANPATLAMARDATIDVSRPGSWTVFGVGVRTSPQWHVGVCVTAIGEEGAGLYSLSPRGGYTSVLDAGDFLVRASIAYRYNARHSFGLSLKYLEVHRGRYAYADYYAHAPVPVDLYQPAIDVGYRLDGIIPQLTFVSWEERTLRVTRRRWQPGARVGISLNNAGVSMNHSRYGDLPIYVSTGISFSPALSTLCCVDIGVSHQYRIAGPPAFTSQRQLIAFGVGVEVNEAVEAGVAITTSFTSGGTNTEVFAALGPPYGRMVVSRVVEQSSWGPRYAIRTLVRFQFDFEKTTKADRRQLPDPYEHL